MAKLPLAEAGPRRAASGLFEMRWFLCPQTGRLLDVEVALPEDPPLYEEVRVRLKI